MKKLTFKLFFLALLMMCFTALPAWAQKPLKGNWTVTVNTAMGALPVPVAFKKGGKGTFSAGATLPITYRENGSVYSIALEAPGLAPDGSDLSFIIRGTKTDSSLSGNAIIITSTADPSNPTGFAVTVAPVSGKRN